MSPSEDALRADLASIGSVLAVRQQQQRYLDTYYEGDAPIPEAVVKGKLTRSYRLLMGMAQAPWGALVVDSIADRIEAIGIKSGVSTQIDDALWSVWQNNQLDQEHRLAHNAAFVSGRAVALVWPGENDEPEISFDDSATTCVQYAEGSRRKRTAAMRFWVDEDSKKPHATLYRPEAIYKFIGPKNSSGIGGIRWERREEDESWPLQNPFGIVPAVDLAVNRRLKPGRYPYARGEYQHCTSLLDRVSLLTFLGLIVAFSSGFPLRGILGLKLVREVLRDDNGEPLVDATTGEPEVRIKPPFDTKADELFVVEQPDARIAEFAAADRGNLSIVAELDMVAAITKTPRHYLPLGTQGMANLSADAIRASESSLISKCPTHKSSLGEGYEEMLRIAGIMLPDSVELPQTAEIQWQDHETRSLAERADAAVKLKGILPDVALLEYVLNATSEQLTRWEAQRASSVLSNLITAAATPVPTPPVVTLPVSGGNGGTGG